MRDFAVSVKDKVVKIQQVPLTSLPDVYRAFQEKLGLPKMPNIDYYDEAISQFVHLDHLDQIQPHVNKFRATEKAPPWWWVDTVAQGGWVEKGEGVSRYSEILLKDFNDTTYKHPELKRMLDNLVAAIEVDISTAKRVTMVQNKQAMLALELYRDHLYTQHRLTPELLNQKDWKVHKESKQKEHYLNIFEPITYRGAWQTHGTVTFIIFFLPHFLFVAKTLFVVCLFSLTSAASSSHAPRNH